MDYNAEEIALAVAHWIESENESKRIKKEMDAAVAEYKSRIREADMNAETIRLQLEAALKEYGVAAEDVDLGAFMNIRIALQPYQPALEVAVDAVPEEFLRVKMEVNKDLINKTFADAEVLPNWLTRPPATVRLVKRVVKKD